MKYGVAQHWLLRDRHPPPVTPWAPGLMPSVSTMRTVPLMLTMVQAMTGPSVGEQMPSRQLPMNSRLLPVKKQKDWRSASRLPRSKLPRMQRPRQLQVDRRVGDAASLLAQWTALAANSRQVGSLPAEHACAGRTHWWKFFPITSDG